MVYSEDENRGHVQRHGVKEQKVFVFNLRNTKYCGQFFTYTVVDPRAVVVKNFDTVVTDRTVAAAWGSVELTRDAPFHPHLGTMLLLFTM